MKPVEMHVQDVHLVGDLTVHQGPHRLYWLRFPLLGVSMLGSMERLGK